ncbi:ABC transporter permease [Leucobacter denitrificans]|uniref:ABC transporter permease n=1 Tax=Leucobacter denitrificans TaxID=683042 RepID=A0A7G9S6G5_9MICO|nr:ABC transporter permease [Leucobacter denitrificans]QNN63440.1 ABC transporter permease [Leucobacter denitrificans]
MTRFILGRVGLLAIAWLLASVLIFATLRILPGDVALVIGGSKASPERTAQLREALGLNQPILTQYFEWIGGVLRFDLGESVLTGASISAELIEKAEVTVPLTLLSLAIVLVVALPLGVFAAYKRSSALGQVVQASSVLVSAIPVVWAGLLGIIVLSTWLQWLPSQGFPRDGWSEPWLAFRALILPALTIGLIEGAILFRFVRSATLRALEADHVRTAMSQGNSRLRALLAHGLPGVGLSVVSVLGLQAAALLVGAVVVEQLFSLPGLGRMLVTDVGNRDLTKVQSTILVMTGIILALGALVDVVHRLIDPRMKGSSEE